MHSSVLELNILSKFELFPNAYYFKHQ